MRQTCLTTTALSNFRTPSSSSHERKGRFHARQEVVHVKPTKKHHACSAVHSQTDRACKPGQSKCWLASSKWIISLLLDSQVPSSLRGSVHFRVANIIIFSTRRTHPSQVIKDHHDARTQHERFPRDEWLQHFQNRRVLLNGEVVTDPDSRMKKGDKLEARLSHAHKNHRSPNASHC